MLNTSKGRKPATSMAVSLSDGSLFQIFSEKASPATIRAITDLCNSLKETADLISALKAEREERERLEAVLSIIKRSIDNHNKVQTRFFKTR